MTAARRDGADRAPLRAVVFDMDGVLIDTEPVWRSVEISVFASLGLHITDAQCRQTMGMRVNEVVAMWHDRHPWPRESIDDVTGRIVAGVAAHVRAHGAAMEGVDAAFGTVRRAGLVCAVASSSPAVLIDAVLDRLGLRSAVDVACSAADDAHGKPAPDVYLRTASALGVSPASCLAIEDSVNGVLSARAAGMPCLAIPDEVTAADPRLAAASASLGSLTELDDDRLARLSATYFA